MAALNQAKIIKGLREITSGEPDRRVRKILWVTLR